ncbi:protein FAM208B isoform X3 [Tupaia chinensis]|uniref:protein FAM208B isoform X3 n=1 Tax=Tupaia chinensis TaxID=246437 RepID=UPI000FFC43A6|nr:protein FAM208B isoform X3 [Tupaia chinensis]
MKRLVLRRWVQRIPKDGQILCNVLPSGGDVVSEALAEPNQVTAATETSIYDTYKEQDYVKNSGGILDENELRPPSQLHSLLEKIETGFISEKIFETVTLSSDSLFKRAVSLLHTSYLDPASEHGFQYSQVTLVKNDIFLNEYKTFYEQKKASNYTQEELQETYGFLLFETEDQGKVKCVSENYTANYIRPSPGYDCHVAVNANKISHKTSHFRAFELSQYYLYELSGNTVTERPRQISPCVIVAFKYMEPKKMAEQTHKSLLELRENVLISPWKGKLIIQGCMLCDITLRSTNGTVIPTQIPQDLDFKYVMEVSSLKRRLPEAVFRKQNYLEQKVLYQDLCFNLYEVELSNRQGKKIDKLTEYIKNKQLAIIRHLEDQEFFILLTSSALISEPDVGDEQMSLHGLHLFHSSPSKGVKDSKGEDDISLKVIPILPALNGALVEAKKLLSEDGSCPNTLVKQSFQELYKVDRSPLLAATSQDEIKETSFFGKLSSGFDMFPPAEKCPLESLTQLKSYFSNPSGYILEVSTALDLLAQHPQSSCISHGICDAGFSLVTTPEPEFLDSEVGVRKNTETENNSKEMLKVRKRAVVPLSPASNLRVQPKRKASMPPIVQSKRVNLCRPFSKKTAPVADNGLDSPTTLKLIEGQFPQKRKRGAEVLTAQFVQKAKLARKNQDAPISKAVPVATNAKRARKQEKSPVKTVPRAKQPVKKSPQKQRVNIVKGNQNPRIRKQPQNGTEETASQLQSEILSGGQEGTSINTAQPENTTMAQKDLPENSMGSYDSQALNMLADLALSSATSSTPPAEPGDPLSSSEMSLNDALLSKENSLRGTYDHEYHRGVKSLKGGLLPVPSSDRKNNAESDLTVNQDENNSVSCSFEMTVQAQSSLTEETLESSDVSQSSFVAVEHSYAVLLGEHSKKHLQQRGVSGPAFAKNGTKGPEAGTPVGKVMPFRHQQNTSPLQKVSEDPLLKHRNRLMSSSLNDFYCSHTVFSCDGSFKVTFKCETDYSFRLDSKYTSNPLERTVVRALHGPWNTDLPENVEEVKLLLHMWVALFYSSQNKVIRSSRKVVEHSNPDKYVSINTMLESFELSEIAESPNMERCSTDPVLETNETSASHAARLSFSNSNCLLPFLKPPPARGLELCVQNKQEEIFIREFHPDTPENQNFIYTRNSEVIGGKAQQESSGKLETSNLTCPSIGCTQINGPSLLGNDKTCQPLDSTRGNSYNDTVTQATFTKLYDGTSNQSVMCQKSMYSTLESKVDTFLPTAQTKTGAFEDLIQHNSSINNECQPSLERKDDHVGYVMINLEPVTLTFEKNAYIPLEGEVVNTADKPTVFNTELIKQVSPATSLRHSKDKCSLQKEITHPVSSSPSDKAVVMEALSLVKSPSCPLPSDEMKHSQGLFLQTQSLFSISSEEIIEPSQVEVVSSASANLEKNYLLNHIPSRNNTFNHFLEVEKNDSSLNSKNRNFESVNSVFSKQTGLPMIREEVSLELSEEDSDIDLTLTISPPVSPREKIPTGEIEQFKENPISNLELQNITEEIVEPEEVTLTENREMSSVDYMSVYPTVSEEPLINKETKDGNLQPVTLIVSKENCTLEIAEEINVTSDFPFDSLIEEVSPASSPDPPVPTEETRPSQAVSSCSLKLHGTRYEKSNSFSQIESGDLTITEKENTIVGPAYPVGQENLTHVQQMQLSAEMPLILINHPGRKDKLILPGKATEKIVPGECGEGLSLLEKVPCCDTELYQTTPTARGRGNTRPSLEKPIKSGTPLQPISIENRTVDLEHVLESSDLENPFSLTKIIENKSLTDTLVSTTASPGIATVSLKQQTTPKTIKKNLENNLETDKDTYLQVRSFSSESVVGVGVTQPHMHLEIPKLDSSSDSTTLTHYPQPKIGESGPQKQEIPVRMANLSNSNETQAKLHEETTDLSAVGPQSNTKSLKDEQKIHMLQDMSTCETKELLNGVFSMYSDSHKNITDISENINKETSASFAPKSFDCLVYGVSKEHLDSESTSQGLRTDADSRTLDRNREISVNPDMHYEPLSGHSDEDCLGRNLKRNMEDSCTLRGNCTRKNGATKDGYSSFMSRRPNDNEDWGYSNQVLRAGSSIPPRNWPTGIKRGDKRVPCYVQIRDLLGIPRTYANFTITKEVKDTARTLHTLRRYQSFTENCSLLSSLTSTWQVTDSLTQNTLDMEFLRFAYKVKQIVKSGHSQRSVFSANVFPKESPIQVAMGPFPLTKSSEVPIVRSVSRSRSPLLVTVMHSDAREQDQHRRGHTSSNLGSSSSFWKERCCHGNNLTKSQKNQTVSFHLNKLKYNSTLKDSRNDISLILNEYAEFDKVMMNSKQVVLQDKELNVDAGEATSQERYSSFPRRSASYEDMITDLCTNLHVKLTSVMKEACKSTFLFYIVETEDKSFFVRTKNILRKRGHKEIEPQHFCQAFHRENDTFLVIIRNEDLSSHLHQIPSLLKLKHFPSVIFAGVDCPEDVLDYTYQELFRTGGFVISDEKILETLTLVQLKEMVKILEKLNGNGRWKWLLHYRENKKLKEDVRVDSIAHKKNLILKSYQSANIIELLHYHQCDSRSSTKADILKCLINLQIQHISARFAVFLTDKPTVAREVFENSGILVTDVNNFIENIQKIAAPFRSSYW